MSSPTRQPNPEAPIVTPDNQPFWEAAGRGRLAIKHCDDCQRPFWYPRSLCPRCLSPHTRWIDASGQGVIYSFSAIRGREEGAHVIAYVTLEEGVTLVTNLVDCDADQLQVGQPVRAVFKPAADGAAVPFFTPA